MSKTLTLAGDVNAVDTLVRLTGQGSVSAPTLIVPAGMTKIKKVIFAGGHDGAADDGSIVWFLRLGGPAIKGGEQALVCGAAGNQTVQAGSDAAPNVMNPFVLEDVDIEVTPSDSISVAAEMAGVDIGDTAVVVTIIFSA